MQATRRMLLSVAPGPELEWMREQAHRQGPHLLDPFDPYIGNPFQGKQEWDYCVAVGGWGSKGCHQPYIL
jgi:hypothetical protein